MITQRPLSCLYFSTCTAVHVPLSSGFDATVSTRARTPAAFTFCLSSCCLRCWCAAATRGLARYISLTSSADVDLRVYGWSGPSMTVEPARAAVHQESGHHAAPTCMGSDAEKARRRGWACVRQPSLSGRRSKLLLLLLLFCCCGAAGHGNFGTLLEPLGEGSGQINAVRVFSSRTTSTHPPECYEVAASKSTEFLVK